MNYTILLLTIALQTCQTLSYIILQIQNMFIAASISFHILSFSKIQCMGGHIYVVCLIGVLSGIHTSQVLIPLILIQNLFCSITSPIYSKNHGLFFSRVDALEYPHSILLISRICIDASSQLISCILVYPNQTLFLSSASLKLGSLSQSHHLSTQRPSDRKVCCLQDAMMQCQVRPTSLALTLMWALECFVSQSRMVVSYHKAVTSFGYFRLQ